MTGEQIIKEVTESGLRGRGGAAFPTGIKWKTAFSAPADEKYVVCNADEGDSGTFSDRMIMEGDPFTLIEGMTIAALAIGANQGYIYLRSEYPHAHRMLDYAIHKAYSSTIWVRTFAEAARRSISKCDSGPELTSAARKQPFLKVWKESEG